LTLAEEGCNLAICARRKGALDLSAGEISAKGAGDGLSGCYGYSH